MIVPALQGSPGEPAHDRARQALQEPLPDAAASAGLSGEHLRKAVRYNQARPYTRALWKQIQAVIGTMTDGNPGPATAKKLTAFQERNGLDADGKAGPKTLCTMGVGRIFQLDDQAYFYSGPMSIDADGAPNAYNPYNTGIDFLSNAGRPGSWWGLACDRRGKPYLQGKGAPFPGYYVSTTALYDQRYPRLDPRRYVDATAIPYIVLPRNIGAMTPTTQHASTGDLAVVVRVDEPAHVVYAIQADVGPAKRLDSTRGFGEGSVKLAQALGHDPFVMHRGVRRAAVGISAELAYIVFPGSGTGRPLDPHELAARGAKVFAAWGGHAKLAQALARLPRPRG